MADDNNPDTKKAFPNSFLFFLLAAVLVILMVQNFVDTKLANVSFSYQLEHLVNLDLITPEESRKSAGGEKLVTFSGRFRETIPQEGKQRYKYLKSLNDYHALVAEKGELETEMKALRTKIVDASDSYLHLSGQPLPRGGYRIVDSIYDTPERVNSVIVRELSDKKVDSILDLENRVSNISATDSEQVRQLGSDVSLFIKAMRSPVLGVGDEAMKQKLKDLEIGVEQTFAADKSSADKLKFYTATIDTLRGITDELGVVEDNIRLSKLRSVRNYREAIERFDQVIVELDDTEVALESSRDNVADVVWFYNDTELSTKALEEQNAEQYGQWFTNAEKEWEAFSDNRGLTFKAPDQSLNMVLEKRFKSEPPPSNYFGYLFNLLPVLLVVLLLYFIFSRQMKGGVGNSAMNFGKSPAKLLQKGQHKVTFKDVAGLDESIEELQEIVEFLKNPSKFTALGGRIPKGVLCIGPPGTGKTLIARAVAGEADRPFFSISGSDFVEMFVGVGASRIRDMFEQAKKNAPCIIFMDEIDAVGRHRGAGIGGGHDEREQTLNQLLVEMDGFDATEGVILVAATNRPDVLDKALLRPGRFDRQVILGLPDIKGRYEILKVHARKIKLDESVDLMIVARSTPGVSGADLENILNESALLAARKGRTAVTEQEVMEARDKVIYGKERRSMEIDENEKKTTAYHESGHAIVGLCVEHSDPVDKVTIIPRGMSLGSTMFLPEKNRTSYWRKELLDQLAVLMGGRCAEEIFVHDMSSGAQQDIERATSLARSMVCEWGMSEKLGTMAYEERSSSGQYLGMREYHDKKYSETTAKLIDDEVRHILDEAHDRALKVIEEHREQVELMTSMLIEFETLDRDDVKKIISGEWDSEHKRQRLKEAEERHKKKEEEEAPAEEKSTSEEAEGEEPFAGLSTDLTV